MADKQLKIHQPHDKLYRAAQVLQELRNLAPKKKGVIMNALQRLRNEGMQQGIQTRNIEIAKRRLADGESLNRIMQWTDLSEEVLKELQ